MKATVEYVQRRFGEFNRLMFGGRLPMPPVVLSDAKTFLGACHSLTRTLPDGRREHYGFQLRISTRLDLPEATVEDVIIHEMIHYFILLHGLEDTAPHGAVFRAVMASINAAHGRHVSVSHRMTPEQTAQSHGAKAAWHVVAAVRMRGGEAGVKVLPRRADRILAYHRAVVADPGVEAVTLVMTDNPFFGRFPVSAALRVHPVDAAILEDALAGASLIRISAGGAVTVTQDRYAPGRKGT